MRLGCRVSQDSDVCRKRNQLAVFGQDCANRDYECLYLKIDRGRVWRLKHNFERYGVHVSRRRQHSFVNVENDAITRRETIYGRIHIPRKNFACFPQGGSQQVLRQRVAFDKAIDSLACVVGVQLDNSVEPALPKFLFENLYFGLRRVLPELPVEIATTSRVSRVVFKSCGVAQRINLEFEVVSQLWFFGQQG